MTDIKKKTTVKAERTHATGQFAKKGTDKQFPKETSISKLDRPDRYKPRSKFPADQIVTPEIPDSSVDEVATPTEPEV